MILELLEVGLAEESTGVAHVDTVAVRDVEKTLFEEAGRSMRDHTVTLHLSETQTSISGSSFGRLSGQDLCGSSTSSVDLISDHMLKPLIEGGSEEDKHIELLSSESVVHGLVSMSLVAELLELLRDIVDSLALEGCRIALISVETGDFTEHTLNQMTNSHTGWNSVRVHNHVRNDTLHSEGQIFLSVRNSTGSFLTVTGSELISDLRDLDSSQLDLH
jgi:hypothetical protein